MREVILWCLIYTERSGNYVKGSRFQHAEKLQFAKVCVFVEVMGMDVSDDGTCVWM